MIEDIVCQMKEMVSSPKLDYFYAVQDNFGSLKQT